VSPASSFPERRYRTVMCSASLEPTAVPATQAPIPGERVGAVRLVGTSGSPRYHELDSLRGSMMMLGLVLHSAVAYMQTPMGDMWGFKDQHTNLAFDVLVAFLHTFRVPVFFALAGFFAALLYERRGMRALIENRARRVLGPLVVGWIALFPLTIAGFAFAQSGGELLAVPAALRYVVSADVPQHLQLLHLWFLFDLLIYYAGALLVCRLIVNMRIDTRRKLAETAGTLVLEWYGPIVLAALTVITLLPMQSGMLETPGTFRRPIGTLTANAVFFAFGWVLFVRRDSLSALTFRAWGKTIAGCCLFPIHALALTRLADGGGTSYRIISIASLAAVVWLLVYGLLGLAVRYLARPNVWRRYLADASYWCYLIHLPIVAWGSGLLSGLAWPAGLKYLVLLASVLVVCLVSYDLLVRPTFLGVALNGRRYHRAAITRRQLRVQD
jgi:glucan biosynthesis protein C